MDKLLSRVRYVTQNALACGSLESIPTTERVVEEQGVPFLVRVLDNLARKEEAKERLQRAGATDTDPFLPHDPALYVADVSPRHRCLLNKFNVVKHHLLLVTRDFESQSDLLDRGDFQALCECMSQLPSLGFFNGGKVAGASQPHKHLQLLPLPMDPFQPLPFSSLLNGVGPGGPQRCDALSFRHGLIRFAKSPLTESGEAAGLLETAYLSLREFLLLDADSPYNLLVTEQWMMLVPRTEEKWQGVSFNALAFCGAILVRDSQQAEQLIKAGLMCALEAVT